MQWIIETYNNFEAMSTLTWNIDVGFLLGLDEYF